MIREKTIARIFAAILLIGIFCAGYVILTQPTGMIAYQTQGEEIHNPYTEKISQEEMLEIFEEEWKQIQDQLVILEEAGGE